MDHDCIFCHILAGDLPSFRVAENDDVVAIMDINPANPGHVLVITREHAPSVLEISPRSLQAAALMAQRVARAVQEVCTPEGITLIQANGPGAAQSVPHFHLHVLPRRLHDGLPMNWLLAPGDRDLIAIMAERLRAAMK